ncbi:hypothetical protein GCM10020331_101790 [Ectobacillus funiculus]
MVFQGFCNPSIKFLEKKNLKKYKEYKITIPYLVYNGRGENFFKGGLYMSQITQARVVTALTGDYQDYQTNVLGTLDYLVEKKYGDDYDFINIPFPNGENRYLILNAEYTEEVLQTKQKNHL